jgi:hypothetical protein
MKPAPFLSLYADFKSSAAFNFNVSELGVFGILPTLCCFSTKGCNIRDQYYKSFSRALLEMFVYFFALPLQRIIIYLRCAPRLLILRVNIALFHSISTIMIL